MRRRDRKKSIPAPCRASGHMKGSPPNAETSGTMNTQLPNLNCVFKQKLNNIGVFYNEIKCFMKLNNLQEKVQTEIMKKTSQPLVLNNSMENVVSLSLCYLSVNLFIHHFISLMRALR